MWGDVPHKKHNFWLVPVKNIFGGFSPSYHLGSVFHVIYMNILYNAKILIGFAW